jgi:outer membrane protein TolC
MLRLCAVACTFWAFVAVCASARPQTLPTSAQPPNDPAKSPAPKAHPATDGLVASTGLPITLATALHLANARALDVQLAAARVQAASAALERAQVLWLPTLNLGGDYARHDGQIQDVAGSVFTTSRSSLFLGAGPTLNIALSEALLAPLAARQVAAARRADLQTATNDTTLAVSEAYFTVQQARGELIWAEANVRYAEDLVRRAEQLAPGIAPTVEANRARYELTRRKLAVTTAQERWRVAGADLARLIRLDPAMHVEPLEPPYLKVTLVNPATPLDDLIALGLTNRPELAARQMLVQATLALLRQERLRPLMPSVILRPAVTSPTNLLAGGYFGGGINSDMRNFGARGDWDVQLVWELQNLGLGNRARQRERQAEYEAALVEVFRIQDRVAADVVQAHAQVESAQQRLKDADAGLREAAETLRLSLEGLSQTRRAGDVLILVVRPSEAVQALQGLAQASTDYYAAVADYDRAQFRLYRALGQPAQSLALPGADGLGTSGGAR